MNIIISGNVIEGNKIGTSLGFPTANLEIDPLINLENGVYAVGVTLDGFNYYGMANIGTRPTVTNDGKRLLEVNIFGYSGDTYGRKIAVRLIEFIRTETKFTSTEELRSALENDKIKISSLFIR